MTKYVFLTQRLIGQCRSCNKCLENMGRNKNFLITCGIKMKPAAKERGIKFGGHSMASL